MDEALTAIISLANKLGAAGFASLLLVILYGHWKGIWKWGKDVKEHVALLEKEKVIIETDRDWWRAQTIRLLGIGETQATALHVMGTRAIKTLDDVNKKLLGGEGA